MTIATFRKVHNRELKEVFKKFGLFLKSVGLTGGKEVCIDGTKMRGVNNATAGAMKNFSPAHKSSPSK